MLISSIFLLSDSAMQAASYSTYGMVNKDMIAKLAEASSARQTTSEDFAKRQKNIDRYRNQKEQTSVILNEEKFLAERQELNADKEEEEPATPIGTPSCV